MTRKPTEMEERVAEAIKSVDDSKPKGGLGASYLSLARAAIRAMREPTQGAPHMKNAACVHLWYDMIDAASPGDAT